MISPETLETYQLKELAYIFKGRAMSTHSTDGKIAIINITNIKDGMIDYANLKSFDEKQHLISRYFLEDGDLLITSKGTQLKLAVFQKQTKPVVASSNITVVRSLEKVRGYYLKLFFETPLGRERLKEIDHGKSVLNLSTKELNNIQIPIVPLVKQDYLIGRYVKGLSDYQRKINRANQEWERIQEDVKKSFFNI